VSSENANAVRKFITALESVCRIQILWRSRGQFKVVYTSELFLLMGRGEVTT
jgi:hypothetical protein